MKGSSTTLVFLLFLEISAMALAPSNCSAEESMPLLTHRRIGALVTLLGEPVPSLGSINITYKILDSIKISGGLSIPPLSISAGLGIRYFAKSLDFQVGTLKLTPLLGIGYSRYVRTIAECFYSCEKIPTTLSYLNLGFEYRDSSQVGVVFGVHPILSDSMNHPSHLLRVYPYIGADLNF